MINSVTVSGSGSGSDINQAKGAQSGWFSGRFNVINPKSEVLARMDSCVRHLSECSRKEGGQIFNEAHPEQQAYLVYGRSPSRLGASRLADRIELHFEGKPALTLQEHKIQYGLLQKWFRLFCALFNCPLEDHNGHSTLRVAEPLIKQRTALQAVCIPLSFQAAKRLIEQLEKKCLNPLESNLYEDVTRILREIEVPEAPLIDTLALDAEKHAINRRREAVVNSQNGLISQGEPDSVEASMGKPETETESESASFETAKQISSDTDSDTDSDPGSELVFDRFIVREYDRDDQPIAIPSRLLAMQADDLQQPAW